MDPREKALYGKVCRTIALEHLSNHLHILRHFFDGWGDGLRQTDRNALMDHIKTTERLAYTLDAEHE